MTGSKKETFTVSRVVFSAVSVRGGSEWVFVEVSDPDGCTGTAEISGPKATTEVPQKLAILAANLRGVPVSDEATIPDMLGLSVGSLRRNRVLATAVSGLRSAVLDAQARRAGVSLAEYLVGVLSPSKAGSRPRAVELYANINRSMRPDDDGPVDRSPAAFARMAARARAAGFKTIKCAPFDEARAPFPSRGLPREARPGLERIAAVRDAIGGETTLLIDCHSRFDLQSALALEPELHALGVGWFEEPVDPIAYPDQLAQIRAVARMPVAGAEHGYGHALFESLIEGGSLDVVMPDVKYCGGAGEAASTGRLIESKRRGSVSLHSPSGPISLLASAHVTAAFGGSLPLEHAIAEVPWRAEVIDPPERVENGSLVIPPGPGLGASLNHALLTACGRRWTV